MEIDLIQLNRALFNDLGIDRKTCAYVIKRLRNEGVSVVTRLLPSFAKHVLLCIEQGTWTYFGSEVRTSRGLPVIFQGFLRQIFEFDTESGLYRVRSLPDPVSLYVIRQACEYLYKLALPFSPDVVKSYTERFEACDLEVPTCDYDRVFVDAMRANFETHYERASKITLEDVASSAGPGPGTFSGSNPETFWMRNFQSAQIPAEARGLVTNLRFNRRSPVPQISTADPDYSQVLFVPKDSRGPRVIVREPYLKLQFQMGYNTQMAVALEKDTHYRINFASQEVNQKLARTSSIDRKYATLDLKDASDRVSYTIVAHLFRYTPLAKVLSRFRTPQTQLPDGRIIPIRKLAGMGSGFTFPTMSLVIHLAICTLVSRRRALPYRYVMKNVYVYGDDIIVPTTWYDLAVEALSKVSLAVNLSKSYWRSYFRESCGGDFFFGNDVAPARLKLASANPKADGTTIRFGSLDFGILGLERHARELVKKQLHSVAAYMYKILESQLGPLPLVGEQSHVLGRLTLDRNELHNSLELDELGTHLKRKLWVAKPIRGHVKHACPYRYLRRLLDKVEENSPWVRDIFPGGGVTSFGVTAIPRKVMVVRRKLSSYSRT